MKSEILKRKGPRKAEDIQEEVLDLLNLGQIETVNLTEWLAIDHVKLIKHNFPEMGISDSITENIVEKVEAQKKPSTMNTTKLVGALLYESLTHHPDYQIYFNKLSSHTSDSIRGYSPFLISLNGELSIEEKFNQSKRLVADTHFGVREIIWIALRPAITETLPASIEFLSNWAENDDENIRRFTGVFRKVCQRLRYAYFKNTIMC